jgi:hypothetical protein
MRQLLGLSVGVLCLGLVAQSCGSEDGKKKDQPRLPDEGEGGEAGVAGAGGDTSNNPGGGAGSGGVSGSGGSAAAAGGGDGGSSQHETGGAGAAGDANAAGMSGSGPDADACPVGMKNCETSNPDCETDVSTVTTCGACDVHCDANHGTPICENYQCVVPEGACAAGYADCDNDGRNGCEVALTTDNGNCGACGRVCQGGVACSAGMCSSEVVVEIGSSVAGEDVIFTPERVFFSSWSKAGTEIGFAPRSPATLPQTPTWLPASQVASLTADASYLYFLRNPYMEAHTIRKINVDGSGLVSPVNDDVGNATQLRSNATAFFMLSPENVPTTISTVAKGSAGSPVPIVTGRFRIYQYLLTPTKLVWIEGDAAIENPLIHNIYVAPLAGGSGDVIKKVPGDLVWDADHYKSDMASDGTYLYWSQYGGSNGKIRRYLLDGSAAPDDLAFDLTAPTGMAVDDKYVYFLAKGSTLFRLRKTGGALPEVVTSNTSYMAYIDLVDDKYVWGHNNNSLAQIVRTPK